MKNKTSNKNRILTALGIFAVLGLVFCFSGCSENKGKTTPFQVTFSSMTINESAITEFGNSLLRQIPELAIEGTAPLFTSIIMGEARNNPEAGIMSDPMMGMAGMMRMAATVSTGEIDVFIADMDNGARNARSDMFLSIDKIFPGEDLSALEDRLLSFDIMTTDAYEPKPTGEKTPVCGIKIIDNDQIRRIFGNQEVGVFIISNTKNLELAKKVMRSFF